MQTVEMLIRDQSAVLNPSELAEFLYLFPAVNRALSRIVPAPEHDALREPTAGELLKYRHGLGRFSPNELDCFFEPRTSPDLLKISHIRRESPLEITLCGCVFLITLGVIFSGGKINILRQTLKAELPPLGKGLQALRDTLGLNKNRLNAGFGIRETIIKLNHKEYEELNKQDDASKNKGGFQHFLVGLKGRINRQTLELRLSPSDLERIHRHKANPKKGGWQGRFKKIFGRHFPEDGETLL
jgi:hypothetical protein